ncbi:MAG: hypothetical protein J6X18_15850 [Bacteroidales bacterium]|nr:hypothetical protein [Bacteroidales bacterium]
MHEKAVGNERRLEMLGEIMKGSTFLPRPVLYKDIDNSFKEWVEEELKISYNDKVLPTMTMYSNQRFTEYSQTWQYTDDNKNLLLNFKAITRENNPQYGKIQGGLWNIPGEDRFYPMLRKIVLDDNGSESFLDLEMRQPMAVDFSYTVSIFTTNFETINEFNLLVNDKFKARQAYVCPNGHYMPMNLDDISDRSSYQINDRQFYSQNFTIKLMGYVIKEDDFRVKETPLKAGVRFTGGLLRKKTASIDIEEYENPCNEPDKDERYYKKPVTVSISFPECVKSTEFELDIDFVPETIELENVKMAKFTVNGEEVDIDGLRINEGSTIGVRVTRIRSGLSARVTMIGYDARVAYDKEKDNPEIDADFEQYADEYEVNAK